MVAYFYVVLGLRFLGERTPNFGIRDKAIPRGVRVLSAEISLIAELEDALKVGSWEKRGEILKRVEAFAGRERADLFYDPLGEAQGDGSKPRVPARTGDGKIHGRHG